MTPGPEDLIDEGVARGIISAAQRDALRALELPTPRTEAAAGFTAINVAYGLGALMVLFASAWFLIARWATLGAGGVLTVVAGYAGVLWWGGIELGRRQFPRAGQLVLTLAISLVPVMTWATLRLTGEWPVAEPGHPLWRYPPFAATRYLLLALTTLLAALVTWRWKRFPALTVPLAVSAWWIWFQVGHLSAATRSRERYDQWLMLGAGFALLAAADGVDRWQRRSEVRVREGDFAGPLWITAAIAFSFAFMVIWLDRDDWRHIMLPTAAGLIGVALRTRRRAILIGGVAGVFGYLAWLAADVFRDGALFPLALAGLGIAMIFTTVWLQKRFPALAARVGGADGKDLPWPHWLSWVPALVCIALTISVAIESGPDSDQQAFVRDLKQRREAPAAPAGPRLTPADSTAKR